ncbi:MAG TPA: glycosyltransferase family 4 protein [Myxococcota bacterium]|nr:glycosyltransferase family 4 protein [Myxococcota bacterium]
MRPLRICFLAYRGNMHSGGQGVYLWHLSRELARRGHEVHVFVGPPYPDPMPFAKRRVELPNPQLWGKRFDPDPAALLPRPNPFRIFEPLNFYELAATWFGFLPEPFAFSVRAFRALVATLREGARYDIVHDIQSLGYGLLAVRALGLPLVTTVHHPLSVDRRSSFARDRTLREALGTMEFYPVGMQAFVARRLDAVLTSSRTSAAQIRRDFRVRPKRLRMVWNGIDTEWFRPRPEVARSTSELLCVARASDPNKGVATLIRALARLPHDVTLTLVDEDHAEHEGRRLAHEIGCAGRLRVVGRVSREQLVRLYARATLVVVPSLYEGFGLPAVEAMACGTPVVASAAGALPEVMAVGGAGTLVPPADAEALAKAIAELLAAPEARSRLSSQARPRIEAAFSWPRVAEATVTVYREILDARRVRGRPASRTTSASDGMRRATALSS